MSVREREMVSERGRVCVCGFVYKKGRVRESTAKKFSVLVIF